MAESQSVIKSGSKWAIKQHVADAGIQPDRYKVDSGGNRTPRTLPQFSALTSVKYNSD